MSLADYNALLGSVVLTVLSAAFCIVVIAFTWHLFRRQ